MQEKILFPSLDRLSDYLVLTVRGTPDAAPAALTVSGAAKVWLRSEGTGYALYTYDTTGTEVRLVHRHDNLTVLQLFSVVEGSLYFNGAALATAASVAQRVRSINGQYPDAAGGVTLSGLVKKVNNISPDVNGNVTISVAGGGLTESQVDDRIDIKIEALTEASHTHENKDTLDNIAAVIEAAAKRNAIIFGGE